MNSSIIGLGRISGKHIAAMKANDIELLDTCDIKKGLAKHEDYYEMLCDFRPDIVAICTPSYLHCKMALAAIGLGIIPIIEKPMALNYEDALSIKNLAKKVGIPYFVVKQNRFNPKIVELKKMLQTKQPPIIATSNVFWHRSQEYYNGWQGSKEFDGGIVYNQLSHYIDMMCYLFGECIEVYVVGATYRIIETQDTCSIIMKMKCGIICSINATMCAENNLEGSLKVIGKDWHFEIDGIALNGKEPIESIYGNGHIKFYEHVKRVIESGDEIDYNEPLRTMKTLSWIYDKINFA